jgi:hypothetical protein
VVELTHSSRLFIVGTGEQYTADGDADGSAALCELRVDNEARPVRSNPGEEGTSSHQADSGNGFARTLITPAPLSPGEHTVSLSCSELSPDVRIATPTLAVLTISTG